MGISMKRFKLGEVVATPGALEQFGLLFVTECIKRHASGDWGDVGPETGFENDHADEGPDTIISVYNGKGGTLWVITEWDRSATTALLPEEY